MPVDLEIIQLVRAKIKKIFVAGCHRKSNVTVYRWRRTLSRKRLILWRRHEDSFTSPIHMKTHRDT